MASSGSIWVSLGLKTSEFTKGISRAKNSLNGFQKFSAGLKNMFNPLTVGLGIIGGLGAAITDAIGIVTEFEKANSKLQAVLGASGTAGAMELMSNQAKELGASTAFTATEVAGLQTELAKLGFGVQEIENMTGAVLDLAAASGTELADAASNAGAIINAFGLESSDAAHVADVMASSFSKSALDMEKFSETMKTAAPIAKATGVSLEVATAAAGKLADANISGSKAGTDLKNIFSQLVKDGKPFAQSLADIAAKMEGAGSKAEKLAIAEDLVGERAKGALLILAEQRDSLGLLAGELGNADGAAKAMADTMLDNVAGDVTKANSAYEGFILSLEDGNGVISEASRGAIQMGTSYIQMLTAINNAKDGFEGFLEMTEAAASLTGAMSQEQAAFTKNIAQNSANMSVLNKMLEDGKITQEKYNAAVKKLGEGWKPANKELQTASTKTIPETVKGVVRLTKAQAEAAEKAKRLKDNFKEINNIKVSFGRISNETRTAFKEMLDGLKDGKPIPVKVPIKPKITLDGGVEGAEKSATPAMIKLGEKLSKSLGTALESGIAGAAVGVGEAFGAALGGGDVEIGTALIGAFSNLLSTFGGQMIALGIAQAALFESLKLGPLGSALAIGGGIALIAAAQAIKSNMAESATAFASGGIVSGPTMGLVGEYQGARNNPEVIAPLDKLKNMIDTGGGAGGEVRFRIEGNELVGILNRHSKTGKYSG
jgi:TP901 family phage tail tape measure protein